MYSGTYQRGRKWPLRQAFEEGKLYRKQLEEEISRAQEDIRRNEALRLQVLAEEEVVIEAARISREEAHKACSRVMSLQSTVNERERKKLDALQDYQLEVEGQAMLKHAYELAGISFESPVPTHATLQPEEEEETPQLSQNVTSTLYSALCNLEAAKQAVASYENMTFHPPESPSVASIDSFNQLPTILDPLDALPECLPELSGGCQVMNYGDEIAVEQEGWNDDNEEGVTRLDMERLKWTKMVTVTFLVLHFLHCLINIMVCLIWLMSDHGVGTARATLYRIFTGLGTFVYLAVTSVVYMWSLRGWTEQTVISRRVKGLILNFFFSDLPIFIVEADIVVNFGFPDTVFTISFILTSFSFAYSGVRAWAYIMKRFIKHQDGTLNNQPHMQLSRPTYHSLAGPSEAIYASTTTAPTYLPPPSFARPQPTDGLPAFMKSDNTDLYKKSSTKSAARDKNHANGVIPASAFRDGM